MQKITVYKVRMYDVATDGWTISRRYATERGAERMGGEILPGSGIEIDASQLEAGEEWTPKNFTPWGNTGFQTRVTS